MQLPRIGVNATHGKGDLLFLTSPIWPCQSWNNDLKASGNIVPLLKKVKVCSYDEEATIVSILLASAIRYFDMTALSLQALYIYGQKPRV